MTDLLGHNSAVSGLRFIHYDRMPCGWISLANAPAQPAANWPLSSRAAHVTSGPFSNVSANTRLAHFSLDFLGAYISRFGDTRAGLDQQGLAQSPVMMFAFTRGLRLAVWNHDLENDRVEHARDESLAGLTPAEWATAIHQRHGHLDGIVYRLCDDDPFYETSFGVALFVERAPEPIIITQMPWTQYGPQAYHVDLRDRESIAANADERAAVHAHR